MKIKHIKTGLKRNITHNKWITEYVKSGKHKKYDILESKDVVELLYEKDDGNVSITVTGIESAENNRKSFPNRFVIKPNSFKYCDKYLVNKSIRRNQSFFSNVIAFCSNIPTLKKIREYIITSTTSKLLGNIVFGLFITVVGGLAVLIIWAIFKSDLIKIFQNK